MRGLDDESLVRQFEAVARPASRVAELRLEVERPRGGAHALEGGRTIDADLQARRDPVVPAAGVLAARADIAADVEPVLGAGHGDVEQAVLFLERTVARLGAPGARGIVGVLRARQPQARLVAGLGQDAFAVARHASRVGQVDDRRLQALRRMYRQDAHLRPAVGVEVALDLAAARLEPAQEALQRSCLGLLVLQRPRQQLIDRVGGLAAQPLKQLGTAAFRAQRLGEEIERRGEVGAIEPARQQRMGARKGGLFRVFAQGAPQMPFALPGQSEELVLVQADQRRLQQAREVEIVLRQQYEARHGEQVLDREFLAQVQTIDARDGDRGALQFAHEGADERVASPHQHHEVSGVERRSVLGAAFGSNQAPGMQRDHPRQAFVRRHRRGRRRARGCNVGRIDVQFLALHQRPQFDPAGRLLAAGQMHDIVAARLDQALRRIGLAEHPVDGVEDGGCRAERHGEFHRHEQLAH